MSRGARESSGHGNVPARVVGCGRRSWSAMKALSACLETRPTCMWGGFLVKCSNWTSGTWRRSTLWRLWSAAAFLLVELNVCTSSMEWWTRPIKYIGILQKCIVPSAQQLFHEQFLFQDDNAPCHRTKLVTKWKSQKNFRTLNWPAQSPDLNLIENIWHKVALEVLKRHPTNKRELIESLVTVLSPMTTLSSWSIQCQSAADKCWRARARP